MESISHKTQRESSPSAITARTNPLTASSQLTLVEVDQANITLPNTPTPTPTPTPQSIPNSFQDNKIYQRGSLVASSANSTPDNADGYYIQLAEQKTQVEDPSETTVSEGGLKEPHITLLNPPFQHLSPGLTVSLGGSVDDGTVR